MDWKLSGINVFTPKSQYVLFSTKGFCPNFITKATKLQGSNNKAKKRTTPQVQQSLNTEPNQKETTKRLAPGGTGTQGRPTCTNYTQIKTSSSLQQGLPQQNKHTNTKKQESFKLPTAADLHM
jgi:hypothetical protein